MSEITRLFPFWAYFLGGLRVALATGPSVVVVMVVGWWVESGNLVPHFYPGDLIMIVGSVVVSLIVSVSVFAVLIGPAMLAWLGAGFLAGRPIDPLSRGGRILAIAIAFFCGLAGLVLLDVFLGPSDGMRSSMEAVKSMPGFLASHPGFGAPGPIAAFWAWCYLRWLDRQVPMEASSAVGRSVQFSQVSATAEKNDREAR